MGEDHSFEAMEHTVKKTAAALRDADVPFLLGGSLASWARGGPETRHDLDVMLRPEDAERALRALEGVGMQSERPPEGWLYKAWDGDVLVDLIFHPKGIEMTDEVFERGEELEVLALRMRVMSLDDMLVTKLLSLGERQLDYAPILQIARALREQIDWGAVRARTAGSPYAKPFFVLVEALGIAPAAAHGGEGRARVRVVEPPPGASRTG